MHSLYLKVRCPRLGKTKLDLPVMNMHKAYKHLRNYDNANSYFLVIVDLLSTYSGNDSSGF